MITSPFAIEIFLKCDVVNVNYASRWFFLAVFFCAAVIQLVFLLFTFCSAEQSSFLFLCAYDTVTVIANKKCRNIFNMT